MKALTILEVGKMEIQEIPMPELQSDDDVIVKVAYSGICHSDIELLKGSHPHLVNKNAHYPLIPGHEWSGVVHQVGKNVTEFKPGDRVVSDVTIGCGCCNNCKTGHYNLCPSREVIGSYKNRQGSFAEYIRSHRRSLYLVPPELSLREAAAIEPAATAVYTVQRGQVKFGDRVLVIGDGSIGLFAVQAAKAFGASKIALVGSWPEKLAIAKEKLGADIGLSYRYDDVDPALDEFCQGQLFDVVLETSGNKSALERAIKYVKPTGVISLVSFYSEPFEVNVNAIILKDAQLHGLLGSPNTFAPTLACMESGQITADTLITQNYDFANVAEAFALFTSRETMSVKIVVKIQDIEGE